MMPAGQRKGPIFERRWLVRIEQGAARVVALRAQPHLSKVGRDHRGGEHDPPGPVAAVHPPSVQSADSSRLNTHAHARQLEPRQPAIPCRKRARAQRSSTRGARASQVRRKTRRNAAIFIG